MSMFIIVSHRDLGDCLLHSIIVATADQFAGDSLNGRQVAAMG